MGKLHEAHVELKTRNLHTLGNRDLSMQYFRPCEWGRVADDTPYYADGVGRSPAKKFELQAYDLRAYLKKFSDETG